VSARGQGGLQLGDALDELLSSGCGEDLRVHLHGVSGTFEGADVISSATRHARRVEHRILDAREGRSSCCQLGFEVFGAAKVVGIDTDPDPSTESVALPLEGVTLRELIRAQVPELLLDLVQPTVDVIAGVAVHLNGSFVDPYDMGWPFATLFDACGACLIRSLCAFFSFDVELGTTTTIHMGADTSGHLLGRLRWA
jgi:hypothetical protein